MEIFFYVSFQTEVDFDFDDLDSGNPGVGGTEYATICLATEIANRNLCSVTLISNIELKLNSKVNFLRKSDLSTALLSSEVEDSYFVFRPKIDASEEIFFAYKNTKAKLVAWTHVSPSPSHLRIMAGIENIVGIVALGKRQYFSWIDSPANKKTTVIQNGQYSPQNRIRPSLNKDVTFLGALVPQKGFHLLAEQWHRISQAREGVRLIVIGSGNLYDSGAKLGPLQLAEEKYENQIITLLGESIDSVIFRGKVDSSEKEKLIANTRVGVVNPSGRTENCPAAALDFQAAGVPVVSARRYGLIDTVINKKSGILVKRRRSLSKAIIKLIDDDSLIDAYSRKGIENIEENFSFSKIIDQWFEFINCLDSSISIYQPRLHDVAGWTETFAVANSIVRKNSIAKGTCSSVIEIKTNLKRHLTPAKPN